MSNKVKKKKKINKVNLWATIVSIVAVIGLIGLIGGIVVIATLLRNKPTLNVSDFDQQESSIVYDSRGEEIANLGTVIRQNIEYDEIPNCVVDAFVAVEDSRSLNITALMYRVSPRRYWRTSVRCPSVRAVPPLRCS